MRLKALVAVAVCAGCLGGSVARAQTLGELAKKEEARRKALKTAGKVVTNEDLPKGTPARPQGSTPEKAPATAAAEDATAKPEESARDKPDEPAKDQAYWKERIVQVREELRRNEMFAEALQTRINALTADFTARDDPHQRAGVAEDRVRALAELDRLKADIGLQKKKIADIEEEARRKGVPPGWLR